VALLDGRGVPFCVIGGVALAVHGFARYTADVDLLAMDPAALQLAFWTGAPLLPEIRAGDPGDPLAGVVRWPADPPHDLLVGRGHAMRFAVDSSEPAPGLGCRVASPLGLVLLKLEAGGPQDRYDILALVAAQRAIGQVPWLAEIAGHLPRLSAEAREVWAAVERDLRA
jgi:hypothetical protein